MPCPCCKINTRKPRQYLCRFCWFKLSPAARHALNMRDAFAMARLQQLHRALAANVPVDKIIIEVRPATIPQQRTDNDAG